MLAYSADLREKIYLLDDEVRVRVRMRVSVTIFRSFKNLPVPSDSARVDTIVQDENHRDHLRSITASSTFYSKM